MIPPIPAGPPVRDRKYWTAVIHNAAQIGADDPRYAQARAVIQMAKDSLGAHMDAASEKDFAEAQPPMPSKLGGMAMNAFQGLTSGLGDEALGGLAGYATLATGGGIERAAQRVQNTQQGFNEQRQKFFGEYPGRSIGSGLIGTAMNPLNKILAPLTAGMGPIATGAAYGATLGGAQGFGEAAGSVTERLPGAITGAVGGGVTGAVLGKMVQPVRALRTNVRGMVRQLLGPKAAPKEVNAAVENVMEATIRKDLLGRLKVHPDKVEAILANWRATGKIDLREPPPPINRPGETITPVQGTTQGFEVTGTRAMPPAPTQESALHQNPWYQALDAAAKQGKPFKANSYKELQKLVAQGVPEDQIAVNYYTRGGKLQQSIPPKPTVTPKNTLLGKSDDELRAMLWRPGDATGIAAARAELIRRLGLK